MKNQKDSLKLPFDQGITEEIIFHNWNPYRKSSVKLLSCLFCVSPGKMDNKQRWEPNDKEV